MTDKTPDHLTLARQCAKMAAQVIGTAPAAVQVEASMMVATAMIIAHTKPEHRAQIFAEYVRGAETEIAKSLKGKNDGRKKTS